MRVVMAERPASMKICIGPDSADLSRGRELDPSSSSGERTVFWDDAVVTRLLDEIDTIVSPGSWIGLALISEETRLSPFMTAFLDKWESLGLPPWTFGVGDPDSWLGMHGWEATSVVVGSPEASYGRWPYAHIPRGTPAIPRAFLTQGWMGGTEGVWRGSR